MDKRQADELVNNVALLFWDFSSDISAISLRGTVVFSIEDIHGATNGNFLIVHGTHIYLDEDQQQIMKAVLDHFNKRLLRE